MPPPLHPLPSHSLYSTLCPHTLSTPPSALTPSPLHPLTSHPLHYTQPPPPTAPAEHEFLLANILNGCAAHAGIQCGEEDQGQLRTTTWEETACLHRRHEHAKGAVCALHAALTVHTSNVCSITCTFLHSVWCLGGWWWLWVGGGGCGWVGGWVGA